MHRLLQKCSFFKLSKVLIKWAEMSPVLFSTYQHRKLQRAQRLSFHGRGTHRSSNITNELSCILLFFTFLHNASIIFCWNANKNTVNHVIEACLPHVRLSLFCLKLPMMFVVHSWLYVWSCALLILASKTSLLNLTTASYEARICPLSSPFI